MAAQILTRQFSGTLQTFSVPESLQLISGAKKSGVLAFGFDETDLDLKIAFKAGRVVGVNGKNMPRLSEALRRLGVPADTVHAIGLALNQHNSKDTQDSPALAQIDRRILEQALEIRVLSGLLLIWNNWSGVFNFVPTASPPATFEPGLVVEALILEAARRMDELNVNVLIDPMDVYAVAERVGDFSSRAKTLAHGDWALLADLNGVANLAQIAQRSLTPWNELLRRVIALESVGLIELAAA